MAHINLFHLLTACFMISINNSSYGYFEENVHGPCTSPDRDRFDTCLFCMPDGYGRDEAILTQWILDGDIEDMCATSNCNPFDIDIGDVYFADDGTESDEDGRYLLCTTDGWVAKYDLDQCDDFSVYNGTYVNCCAPHESDSGWECGDFSKKFCDAGYYGIFNGRENDCTRCPEGYGTTKAPNTKQHGWSDVDFNNTINGCYMLSSSDYADQTGTFKMTNSCYW